MDRWVFAKYILRFTVAVIQKVFTNDRHWKFDDLRMGTYSSRAETIKTKLHKQLVYALKLYLLYILQKKKS